MRGRLVQAALASPSQLKFGQSVLAGFMPTGTEQRAVDFDNLDDEVEE